MERFRGRFALVTGGGKGIGRACAQRLAAEGATVVVADVDAGAAQEAADLITAQGGTAIAHTLDVADPDSVDTLAERCDRELGRMDVLVNNAGVAVPGSVTETSVADWETVQQVNLRSVWLMMRAFIPLMPATGAAIVNMSSCQAFVGFPGWAAYAASKGGIVALTQQAAVDYASRGIRVNAVAPGTILTPMNERIFEEVEDPEQLKAAWGRQHALGRFGMPEEVAAVVAFLASDDASFVTGACVPVDGGMQILGPA